MTTGQDGKVYARGHGLRGDGIALPLLEGCSEKQCGAELPPAGSPERRAMRFTGGHAACWCGLISPHLSGRTAAYRWHREHKLSVTNRPPGAPPLPRARQLQELEPDKAYAISTDMRHLKPEEQQRWLAYAMARAEKLKIKALLSLQPMTVTPLEEGATYLITLDTADEHVAEALKRFGDQAGVTFIAVRAESVTRATLPTTTTTGESQ